MSQVAEKINPKVFIFLQLAGFHTQVVTEAFQFTQKLLHFFSLISLHLPVASVLNHCQDKGWINGRFLEGMEDIREV